MIITEIIDRYDVEYCIVSEGGMSHIVLMLPYQPYREYPAGCVQIDPFYIASNRLYQLTKQLTAELIASGYEVVDEHILLKPMAERGGLGTILHNQLLVNSRYGSKTTLQSITVRGKYSVLRDMGVDKICDSCGKCTDACPGRALDRGVFDRSRCLRHIQDYPEIRSLEMGRRVLGCDECQRACPYNAMVEYIDMPDCIRQMLAIDRVLHAIADGRRALDEFAKVYGRNYARPVRLAMLVVNSLLSCEDYSYAREVALLERLGDDRLDRLVAEYLRCCADREQCDDCIEMERRREYNI